MKLNLNIAFPFSKRYKVYVSQSAYLLVLKSFPLKIMCIVVDCFSFLYSVVDCFSFLTRSNRIRIAISTILYLYLRLLRENVRNENYVQHGICYALLFTA